MREIAAGAGSEVCRCLGAFGFREITKTPAAARTQALSAMMRMIARLNAVALNSAARPKMMLAMPKATAE
jgi:hypothetical protein